MSEEDSSVDSGNIFTRWFKPKPVETVRETIEDLIEEAVENGDDDFNEHEQMMLNNLLDLRDRKCGNIMIPRAEIVAFPKDGNVIETFEDTDGDGLLDEKRDVNGNCIEKYYDNDGNGKHDEKNIYNENGSYETYKDTDGDGDYDIREYYDEEGNFHTEEI